MTGSCVLNWMCQPRVSRARDGVFESLPRSGRIVDAGSREIQADAADAGLAHRVELRVGRLVVDHRDAACAIAELAHAVERARVVGAVDAGLHDHDALEAKRRKQLTKLVSRCGLGRVGAAGEKRILLRIAEHVHVAIAGARRNVEIHFRQRLRRSGQTQCAPIRSARRHLRPLPL